VEEFQMMYLVDKEVDSIGELNTTSKNNMFNAWRDYKATELAT
jgi:hypothetical protein